MEKTQEKEGQLDRFVFLTMNIFHSTKNNSNDSLKIVRTFHFKSQNILIKKYILFKENVPAIFRIRNNQRTIPAIPN